MHTYQTTYRLPPNHHPRRTQPNKNNTSPQKAKQLPGHQVQRIIDREVQKRVKLQEGKIKSNVFQGAMKMRDDKLSQLQKQLEQKKRKHVKLQEIVESFKQLIHHMGEQKSLLIEENNKLKNLIGQSPDHF